MDKLKIIVCSALEHHTGNSIRTRSLTFTAARVSRPLSTLKTTCFVQKHFLEREMTCLRTTFMLV